MNGTVDTTDEAAIRELLEGRYAAHLNSADTEAYAALYHDDVVWAVPNQPAARSTEEVAARLTRILSKVDQTVHVTVEDIIVEGDLAVVSARADGTFAPRNGGSAQPLALHVLWALRRSGDGWSITRQLGSPAPSEHD